MYRTRLGFVAIFVSILVWLAMSAPGLAVDDPPSKQEKAQAEAKDKESADRRFETLEASMRKAPEKADWKALRRAFAETTFYHPYSIDVDKKLKAIALAIGRGEIKESEEALLKLAEAEHDMRFDVVAMLMMLYDKSNQPEKGEKSKKILEGILGVLDASKAGTSYESPIEILFIQEEYLVTTNMPVAGRGLFSHDGHRFDVFDIKADGDQPAHKLYFNVDLPQKALTRSLETLK